MFIDNKKNVIQEIKTLRSHVDKLNEKLDKGTRKEILKWADKVETQARWLSILVGEVYK